MSVRKRVALMMLVAAAVAVAAVLLAGGLQPLSWTLAAVAAIALGLLWRMLDSRLLLPLDLLGQEAHALAGARHLDRPLSLPQGHVLGAAADGVAALVEKLRQAARECDDSIALVTGRNAEQKQWLEIILRDLAEGVLVCGADHRILLYNQAAQDILGHPEAVALGRPLFGLISREPVVHALELLSLGSGRASLPFAAAAMDSSRILQGRIALAGGKGGGYVIAFAESGQDSRALAADNRLRRALSRELRRPLANLRAAAEIVANYPAMGPRERQAFDEVVMEESATLSARIEALEGEFEAQSRHRWVMADLFTRDLAHCLGRALGEKGIRLAQTGIPLWLHGDSHALLRALTQMLAKAAELGRIEDFEMEALLADRRIYLDFTWTGAPLPEASLEHWLDQELEGDPGRQTLRDVFERHVAEPWSQPLPGGHAVLRVPLPAPDRPQFLAEDTPVLPRPIFAEAAAPVVTGTLGARRLKDLDFVVLDTETTGTKPAQDDIVQVGAVRVSHGRVVGGQLFERLVNPGRPIPAASTLFHGITDAMVRDKPPLSVVLPQLRAFVGDAVLAAHNAAFDLAFLRRKEAETGIAFDMPVVDTLLMAAMLDLDGDHSLEAVARRLGVVVEHRHSALSDAMATAEIMLRQFDLLEAKGVTTLDQLVQASALAAEVQRGG